MEIVFFLIWNLVKRGWNKTRVDGLFSGFSLGIFVQTFLTKSRHAWHGVYFTIFNHLPVPWNLQGKWCKCQTDAKGCISLNKNSFEFLKAGTEVVKNVCLSFCLNVHLKFFWEKKRSKLDGHLVQFGLAQPAKRRIGYWFNPLIPDVSTRGRLVHWCSREKLRAATAFECMYHPCIYRPPNLSPTSWCSFEQFKMAQGWLYKFFVADEILPYSTQLYRDGNEPL